MFWQLNFVLNHHHHHHHIALVARISLTLSRHSSLSFIALGRSSGQHPVSSHSCWMYVRAGRPAFARPCVGIHKSTSLISSCLLLQQCPACLVRLTWIVFVIGGRWPYSWCLVGCCCQDLFRIARRFQSTRRILPKNISEICLRHLWIWEIDNRTFQFNQVNRKQYCISLPDTWQPEYVCNISSRICLIKVRLAIHIRSHNTKLSIIHLTKVFQQQPTSNLHQFCDKIYGFEETYQSAQG